MKTRRILLGSAAIALAVAAAPAPAQAGNFHGYYVGVEGGANWVRDWEFDSATAGHSHRFTAHSDTGWALLATLGYDWGHWRAELEGGYRSNDYESITSAAGFTSNTGGGIDEISVMANLHYDFQLTKKMVLSFGVGAGMDHLDIDFNTNPAANVDEWRFAYQGIVGFSYRIGAGTDLTLNYRYLNVNSPELDFGPFNNHPLTQADDIRKQTLTVGFRFDLYPDEEPVMAAPAPAPAPAPTPPAHFVIFFGYNKCNITAEADSVLTEAASAAKSRGSASVTIVGHTDTSGSSAYNQKLSQCRADAAASNLEGKGVPKGAISTSGKGETELMVQTGDGVKEPQNRRATVDLN